jgi:hypothetical protein
VRIKKQIIFFANQKQHQKEIFKKNEATGDNSEVGASALFEISSKTDYGTRFIEDFILHNISRTVTIEVYNHEDTLFSDDDLDLIIQHSNDNLHLIHHAEIDTIINNFRSCQFGEDSPHISSSSSANKSYWITDFYFALKKLTQAVFLWVLSSVATLPVALNEVSLRKYYIPERFSQFLSEVD